MNYRSEKYSVIRSFAACILEKIECSKSEGTIVHSFRLHLCNNVCTSTYSLFAYQKRHCYQCFFLFDFCTELVLAVFACLFRLFNVCARIMSSSSNKFRSIIIFMSHFSCPQCAVCFVWLVCDNGSIVLCLFTLDLLQNYPNAMQWKTTITCRNWKKKIFEACLKLAKESIWKTNKQTNALGKWIVFGRDE